MTDPSHLIARLREDARALELANANHEALDRVLVASAVNLMWGAAELLVLSRDDRFDRSGQCTFGEIHAASKSLGWDSLGIGDSIVERINELRQSK